MEKKDKIKFSIICSILGIFTIAIIARFAYLMLIKEPSIISRDAPKINERGMILDRNGKVLALQKEMYDITCQPKILNNDSNIENINETIDILSETLKISKKTLISKFNKNNKYFFIAHRIPEKIANKLNEKKQSGKLEGIFIEEKSYRYYPFDSMAAHILGFCDRNNIGKEGIEGTKNNILNSNVDNPNSSYGNNIFLTIDSNIQYFTEKIADKAYNENLAKNVVFIVMDAKNADILALSSRPTFNPNFYEYYNDNDRENIAVRPFEPGSVFKIFSVSAALENGKINEDSELFCSGYYKINGSSDKNMKIHCLGIHGSIKPKDIIKKSCNAGAAQASLTMKDSYFYNKIKDFGFGEKVNIETTYEHPGLVNPISQWSLRSKPTIAIGQEILTTPIQIITATTVFTNGGNLLKPHIIKKIENNKGDIIFKAKKTIIRDVISNKTTKTMLKMMEETTLEGTGRRTKVKGIRISTKTGTAEMINPKTGLYSKDNFYASTLAIFPTEKPEIIIYGAIIEPKNDEIYGGRIVAPLIKELSEKIIQYKNISKNNIKTIKAEQTISTSTKKNIKIGKEMPDLKGLSKKEVTELIKQNIIIKIEGSG